jgi:general secretion pathway protein A
MSDEDAGETDLDQINLAAVPDSDSLPETSMSTSTPTSTPTSTSIPSVPADANLATVSDLSARLAGLSGSSNAMNRLLRLWREDLRVAPGSYPCEQLRARNLHCLSGQTDWQTLRTYNRPAIIHLVSIGGEIRQVLLRSLLEDEAVLDFGEHPVATRIEQLDPLWTGEFLLLWRPPIDQTLIGPGSKSAAVVWLRRQLSFVENGILPAGALSDEFDSDLEQMVRRFQHNNNLQVDGLVGAKTLLLLNNAAPTSNTPLLNTPASGSASGAASGPASGKV